MVMLQDPCTASLAAELFVANSAGGEVSPLYGVLGMLFNNGDAKCQAACTDFLLSLSRLGDSNYPTLVLQLLQEFSEGAPDQFAGTELQVNGKRERGVGGELSV